jgi:hypothetical protein
MRTTLTLDDDVAVLLERVQEERKRTFKEIVNTALRTGLTEMVKPVQENPAPFRTKRLIEMPSLIPMPESTSELLAMLEGEDHK